MEVSFDLRITEAEISNLVKLHLIRDKGIPAEVIGGVYKTSSGDYKITIKADPKTAFPFVPGLPAEALKSSKNIESSPKLDLD